MKNVLAAAVLVCLAVARPAWSAPPAPETSSAQPPACASQVRADVLAEREQAIARYEELPRECLQAVFMSCAAQARNELLDLGSAATCSIGYEALLRREFAGNFRALMAWWRTTQPQAATSQ